MAGPGCRLCLMCLAFVMNFHDTNAIPRIERVFRVLSWVSSGLPMI